MRFRLTWIVVASLALVLVFHNAMAQTPEQDIRRFLDIGKDVCRLLGGGPDCSYIDDLDPNQWSGPLSGPYTRGDNGIVRVPPPVPRGQQQLLVGDVFLMNGYSPSGPLQIGLLVTGPQTANYMRTGHDPKSVRYQVGTIGTGAIVVHLVDAFGHRAALELYYIDPSFGDFMLHAPGVTYEGRFRIMLF